MEHQELMPEARRTVISCAIMPVLKINTNMGFRLFLLDYARLPAYFIDVFIEV